MECRLVWGVLTHGSASWSSSGSGYLLAVAVDTPALADAAVALHGLIPSVAVTGGHILADGRARAEEEVSVRGAAQRGLSVLLTGDVLML